MNEANILYLVVSKFADVDLHPKTVPNDQMGLNVRRSLSHAWLSVGEGVAAVGCTLTDGATVSACWSNHSGSRCGRVGRWGIWPASIRAQ